MAEVGKDGVCAGGVVDCPEQPQEQAVEVPVGDLTCEEGKDGGFTQVDVLINQVLEDNVVCASPMDECLSPKPADYYPPTTRDNEDGTDDDCEGTRYE